MSIAHSGDYAPVGHTDDKVRISGKAFIVCHDEECRPELVAKIEKEFMQFAAVG